MRSEKAPGLLAFHVGAIAAALPLVLVREVIESPDVVRVPGSHEHVAGVALHRGVALPVYDLGRFPPIWSDGSVRQESGEEESGRHLIICGFGEAVVGLLGEGVDLLNDPGARSGEGGATENESPEDVSGGQEMSGEYVRGLVRSGERRVAVLDPARLFTSMGVPVEEDWSVGEVAGEEDPAGR